MPLARAMLRTLLLAGAPCMGIAALLQGTPEASGCAESLQVTSHTHAGEVTVEVALTSRAPTQLTQRAAESFADLQAEISHRTEQCSLAAEGGLS